MQGNFWIKIYHRSLFSTANTINDSIKNPQNDRIRSTKLKLKFLDEFREKESNLVRIINIEIIPKPIIPPFID